VALVILEKPAFERPARGRRLEIGLWLLAAACAALTLAVHRPDLDDAFYVNLAVAAADFPDRPLLVADSMHSDGQLPLMLPVYRAHSYELWNGALAWLSGIPAIAWFHWVSAALAALLVPLAHARAFRWLAPREWLWATGATVLVLAAAGETHRWYGNFAFVRMWQGKGIYLFVFLPLVYAYALEFGSRPSRAAWLRLAAAQIAAVGCTSSALWGAPVAAWMALCCAVTPTGRGLRRFGLGALASLYVLAVAFALKQTMEGGGYAPTLGNKDFSVGAQLERALGIVFEARWLLDFSLAALMVAWACTRRSLGQRFAIVLPLAVLLVLWNPFVSRWIVSHVTSSSYWRGAWALPVPMLIALVLIAPLQLGRGRASRRLAAGACLAALLAFAAFVPEYSTISQRNTGASEVRIRIDWPGLKVHREGWRWAKLLNESVPPGSAVVAPGYVNVWVPTFHHHAHPLEVRLTYLRLYRGELGDRNSRLRHLLTLFTLGESDHPEDARLFRRSLDRFDVRGVVLRRSPRLAEAREILREAGFEPRTRDLRHELWVRPDSR